MVVESMEHFEISNFELRISNLKKEIRMDLELRIASSLGL